MTSTGTSLVYIYKQLS